MIIVFDAQGISRISHKVHPFEIVNVLSLGPVGSSRIVGSSFVSLVFGVTPHGSLLVMKLCCGGGGDVGTVRLPLKQCF